MLNTFQNKLMWGARLKGVLAALLLAGSGAAMAANITIDLCATAGATADSAVPNSTTVYGYALGACPASVSAPGGPKLEVNVGDVVTVNLYNDLPTASGMLFQGQSMVPDTTGASAATPGTLTTPTIYGSKSYTFTATNPGTYLYEAALLPNAQHQVAMGLYGALVVRPATAGQAYKDALTVFTDEAVLVLSELDPALNNSLTPATFDMRTFAPKYFLINGLAYPATAPITGTPGAKLLLRYVNAGVKHHSMAVLGLRQNFIAKDGSLLPTLSHNVAAETLAPGQTGDAIVSVPAVTVASKFAVYDASLMLHNNGGVGFGGMLTFVAAGTGTSGSGPAVSALALTGNTVLAATITAASGRTVTAAEYWIDAGTHTPLAMGTPAATVNLIATVPAQLSGSHTLYVRGQDDASTWGAPRSVVFAVDLLGPTSSALTLSPSKANGSQAVALSATVNDVASGGATIGSAEYAIDGGSAVAMTLFGAAAPVMSASASIPAAILNTLSDGPHGVAVRSTDALGNIGPWSTLVSLVLDKTGPATTVVSASPNPTSGLIGLNSSTPSVRVTANLGDALSNVVAGEVFIDTVGANGTGVVMVAVDGLFNSQTESASADIPLATIRALSQGTHTIHAHGKDAAGNWGAMASTVITVDKLAPIASSVVLTPSATNNSAVGVTASASDVTTGNSNITAGEYFIDVAGVAGTGVAMSGAAGPSTTLAASMPAATVAALSVGNHTVYVRAKDVLGNWGATASATLLIDRTSPTFTGISLTPNSITAGTATVSLTVNGSNDPQVAGLASGVAGGEYWFGTTNITAGTATTFNGTTAMINTSALLVGTNTVRVRIRDAAGNWSTGVRTATLSVLLPNRPTTAQVFGGTVRGANGSTVQRTTTLSITLSNANPAAITGVGVTDNLQQPTNGTLTFITPAPPSTCGGTLTTTQNNNRRLVLTGGVIPANGSCTMTATVQVNGGPATAYSRAATIAVGGVSSANAGTNATAAVATLTVTP